ncbi:MAG: phosphomannomutase/phosphoglucomutase [Candidatus Peregrinibacteria bacterium]
MVSSTIFRAYDIRGVVGEDLDAEVARDIGKAFGTFLIRERKVRRPKVVVGRDGRTSSPELAEAFISGLVNAGSLVTDVGLCASPLLYFSNTVGGFDAGCNITASHNPAEYNGFKLVARGGHAVYGDDLQTLYKIIAAGEFEKGEGSVVSGDYLDEYLEKLESLFRFNKKLKVAVDTGNGVAGAFYPRVLSEFGHQVTELYTELDGRFPNHEPDPIVEGNLRDLKREVASRGADIGLAFDGDGDRVAIVTEKGEFVNADRLLMLLSKDVLTRCPGGSLVFTVSNSQVLFDLVRQWGGNPVMCKVGHSYVEAAMSESGAVLGGEQSGHFFLPESYYPFDDALVTSLRVLKIVSDSGKFVSELLSEFPRVFSEPEMRPYCADTEKFGVLEKVKAYFGNKYPHNTLDGIRVELGSGAWAGIRVSNTSPCLSVIMEAGSREKLDEVKEAVLSHLKGYPEIEWNKK